MSDFNVTLARNTANTGRGSDMTCALHAACDEIECLRNCIAELENTNEKLRNALSQKNGEAHRAYSRIGELKAKFNRMEPVLREEVRDELFGDGVDLIFEESGPAEAYRLGRDNALNCLMHILGSGGANNG